MGHFGGNGVNKYFNIYHVYLYDITGTKMMKDFEKKIVIHAPMSVRTAYR